MTKRSIAILGTRGIPARYGGFETFAEELATRLATAGHRVTVYCEKGLGEGLAVHKGVNLRYISANVGGPLATVLFDARCLWDARSGHDVIYLLGYGAAPFLLIPKLYGQETWINVDGIEWKRAKWSGLAKSYFRLMEYCSVRIANLVIADAHGIEHHLRLRQRTSFKCSVIPYGAEAPETPPDERLLDTLDLIANEYHLVVCRLEPENHVAEIIEGHMASRAKFPLVIVGDINSSTPYTKRLGELRNPNLRFLGTIYDKATLQAVRFYARSYLHGHSVGGTNPSLLEAMACANYTIAHDNDFNREVLGSSGRFFDNSRDIAAEIARAETLPELELKAIGDLNKTRVQADYSWESISTRYQRLIQASAD